MSQFYWNYIYPTGSRQKAYENYLQNTAYVNDINDCISYNSNGIKTLLQENNATAQNINKGISSICGKLDSGFELLGNHLAEINSGIQNISSEISALSSLLDWKLSALVEGQRITNNLLGNISNLLKIPDIQKERVYYIEEGLKYLKNALIDQWDSEFFDDSYSAFNEALLREPKDYISLSKIGFIHLFSKQYLDFVKAEEFFRKSYRYANAEAIAGGTNFSNNLNPANSDFNVIENIHLVSCVESMLYCARACALQDKFQEAIQLTLEAYKKVPTFLTAAYESVKYLCIINEQKKALPIVEELILKDRLQTFKIIGDPDIITKDEIIQLIEELSNQRHFQLNEKIDFCNNNTDTNPIFIQILNESISLAKCNTYLHSCLGIDIIEKKRDWVTRQIDYNYKMIESMKNNSYYKDSNLWEVLISINNTNIINERPEGLPICFNNKYLNNLTVFEYISELDLIKKNNTSIIQECILQLNSLLKRKNVLGIPYIFDNRMRNNANVLINYFENLQ
jgi:hypothetical protein